MEQLLNPALAHIRVEFGMAEAEFAQRAQWRASAQVFRAIDATLREAVAHPEVFIDAQMLRGDATEFAERAAAADLAVRLNLAESTVRGHAHIASTLRERLPRLWSEFVEGEISTQNARESADVAAELPPEFWADFETKIMDAARTMAPARFRSKARAIRERLEADTAEQRHETATTRRGVWTELDRDGMGWLHALLPAEDLAAVTARLDAEAFDHFKESDELRTMAQLRADLLTDLVAGTGEHKVGVTLAITVPMLSLLGQTAPNGQSITPATLEGVGPIDLATARRLAGEAPSITRLLTDPVSGTVLQMDAHQYRPSAALKRWLAIQDVTCDFPGCGRRAANCDLDHTDAWADGGATSAANLTHRCRKHHTMKHQTKWRVEKPPGAVRAVWTSPTGHVTESPPPF
jgi:Domain of unknown function (DUF222)